MTTEATTTAARRVLVSGGGIAGNAVTLQLLRAGIRPTVLERAATPRPGGQAVDLRGPSRIIAERMGLMPAVQTRQLDERGMIHIDAAGGELLRMPAELFGGNGAVAEIEITRGDLNEVLLDAIAAVAGTGHPGDPHNPGIDYRYGEWITEVREDENGVSVTLASGATERFDLLIGADGLHSTTRELVFGPDEKFSTYLGGHMSFFTMPTPAGIEPHWMSMHSMPGGTAVGIRPDADPATCKAILTLRGDADPALYRDTDAQKQLIRERLADGGRLASAILAAMDEATDFYFDELSRITMSQWTTDRVALLGDAGYCGSPLSGQGTAMALVGAYVLAGEIARTPHDLPAALERHTRALRPFIAAAQELPPGGLAAMTPRSRLGIRAGLLLSRLISSRPLQPLMTRALTKTEDYDLPDYPMPTPQS